MSPVNLEGERIGLWFCAQHGWTTEAFHGNLIHAPLTEWVNGRPPTGVVCGAPSFGGKHGICGGRISKQADAVITAERPEPAETPANAPVPSKESER